MPKRKVITLVVQFGKRISNIYTFGSYEKFNIQLNKYQHNLTRKKYWMLVKYLNTGEIKRMEIDLDTQLIIKTTMI